MYKMRDDIFNERYAHDMPDEKLLSYEERKLIKTIFNKKAMFDAGFEAMLEIIEKEIANEELADMKLPKEELF